jgi:hypothetical protein
VRVRKDPSAGGKLVAMVIAEPSAPVFLKARAVRWRDSIEKWKAEPPVRTMNGEQTWAKTKRLLREASEMQNYPADHSADVLFLRVSAAAHDTLSLAPDGPHAAEALHAAGVAYEALGEPALWPLHEIYFEACVRQAPHTAIAAICYKRYEESVYFGYSGSGGMSIPPDVERTLRELRALGSE